MKKFKKIISFGFNESELSINYWKHIDLLTEKIIWLPDGDSTIIKHLRDADCLLVKFNSVSKEWIDLAPNLRYIGVFATGYGKIDYRYAKKKNIAVTNVPGYATESVAEFVFAVILEHIRELARAREQVKQGNYDESTFSAIELKNKNFGIIGAGKIGIRVAQIAARFGCNVRYWDRNRKQELESSGIKYKEITKLIQDSDFLSIHLSLNPKTNKILNSSLISEVKNGAIVINTAPMELFDISALIQRLKKNDITFIWDHPDETDKKYVKKLAVLKNCITYPPIGYISKEATMNKQEIFVQNIENFLKGKPTNKIN